MISKHLALLPILTFVISGCEVTRGGAGQTTAGEPIVGQVWQNNQLQQGFTISSVNGWQCQGVLTNEQKNNVTTSVIQVPITCNNGVTGTSLVSIDRLKGEADINFKLSNGVAGNVEIG
jgi:hypothetical protein